MLKEAIFREYDIRGIVGTELIIEEMYHLTYAIISYILKKHPKTSTIIIGMDGRLHSLAIKDEICKALSDLGMHVTFIGICASPVLYFAVHTLKADVGLMITASHNPQEYNGIKICLGNGSVWGAAIQEIKSLYFSLGKKTHRSLPKNGTYREVPVTQSYIAFMTNHFSSLIGMDLAIVVDCGNGTGGTVMPALIEAMKWPHVQLLYPEVDGRYPNHEADPVKEANMADVKKLVTTFDLQLGIGLDGDCDRMAAMTKKGTLVPGDRLLALFARSILYRHPNASIIADIKSSQTVLDLIRAWNGNPILSPSGHAIIKDCMHRHQALLGGELSCHFFFADRYFGYDDAFYALLRLLEVIHTNKQSLDDMLTCIPTSYSSPEYRIPYDEKLRNSIIKKVKAEFDKRTDMTLITIDGVRATTSYGWGIVRPSNTQPVLCLRFESSSLKGLNHIKNDFIAILEAYIQDSDKKAILAS